MDYPNGFDIGTFRAGKSLALSRIISIWTAIVFFLIIIVCGFILFCRFFSKNYPVLISINPNTNEWKVIAYPGKESDEVPRYQVIQEKLVHDYVNNWFTISGIPEIDEARWKNCDIEKDCGQPAIACESSKNLYQEFFDNVLPTYRIKLADSGETWRPNRPQVIPSKDPSEDGSFWRGNVQIKTSSGESFKVLFFMSIAHNPTLYPATFGYYVNEFYAYRISR